jgi:hypothetical protein
MAQGNVLASTNSGIRYGRVDLDSHADTCVLGKTFRVYEDTGQQCTVYPYSSKYKPKQVNIVHGGTAYDHPNGDTYILDVNFGFDMTLRIRSQVC